MSLLERYREAIIAAIRAIPKGQVSSYGAIARRADLPGRARLVAKLLSSGEHPDIPWHRVLRADGRISFPADSAGFVEQVARLRSEGVEVRVGRVRLPPQTDDSLDRLLWG